MLIEAGRYQLVFIKIYYSLSCPELSKCSPKSQENTRSLNIPDCFNRLLDGRERIKLLKKAINFPCFRNTGLVGDKAREL